MTSAEFSMLGKPSAYDGAYSPDILFAIPRDIKRAEIAVPSPLPFEGADIWNHYEVSWLNLKGKPVVGVCTLIIPASSVNIIESKSIKLYFNSFNNTPFESAETVAALIKKDMEHATHSRVEVQLTPAENFQDESISKGLGGILLDTLDIACHEYLPAPQLLTTTEETVSETVYSNLLKSNCLVTHQPDWASVQIAYQGKQICHDKLLRYLVSFRNHNEFHEQCVERIFMDILTHCRPQSLSVYARYTRRGGIDINPFRTTDKNSQLPPNVRLMRQ